ncbi:MULTISPECIES: hypothetical protein [unclassified Ensifer]|jgi:hypothetical protein|uniref:hypothetical protein n=1 Tax=Ensifer TaxID=106591 RepID=UPI00070924ED|nr:MULTISPECIES: hypothetical protein [unclassified Ensifer]MDP9631359.1 hypothetical protein [Ensifer adhaerens]KQU88784.1 hypothetical protein ASD00_27855 [Ensifer sp. Root31]KQW39822.1 hypothetical protein ASD02_15770 [Ensifer sp. Root1252]KQY61042.1 hypothetical protein ASD52_20735 [Ensifer sp. Root142]KRC60076.1 hypothetical protein ASE32_13650 [Ensifer sp. Root231]
MAKIIALGAYFYQALIAFGLLIVVAHWLAPVDYAAYSLFISLSQFGAIAAFEWVRFSCMRFYPGQTAEIEAAERRTIVAEAAACALFCLVAAAASLAFGVSPLVALVGGLVAVAQGGSDLHLTMLRFRQDFRAFSVLQGSRATILAAGTLIGALVSPTFLSTVTGLLGGYALYALLATLLSRRSGPRPSASLDMARVRKHLVYGSVSAGAASASMFAPLALKAIFTSVLGPGGAAGALLALDLLQRPFVLIVSALQAIQYPEIVAAHDKGGDTLALRRELGQYYALLTSFALMMAAGIFAVLVPATWLVISPDLQAGFLATAPFVIILSLARVLTQIMLPTPLHLKQRLTAIFALAAIDCALLNLFALASAFLLAPSAATLMAGGALGAIFASLIGLRLMATLPFDFTWSPVLLAAAGLGVTIVAFVLSYRSATVATAAGIVIGGVCCLLALNRLRLGMRASTAA